jgi:hypothetical protein
MISRRLMSAPKPPGRSSQKLHYSAEGHYERYANLVRDIVTSSPDLIVTETNPVVIAFSAATRTID